MLRLVHERTRACDASVHPVAEHVVEDSHSTEAGESMLTPPWAMGVIAMWQKCTWNVNGG